MPSEVYKIMEVCGTHTMAIAKSGIKRMLPENIKLISGPGCPVCVTPASVIDAYLNLSGLPNVTLVTYGDMLKVPGSTRGDNLNRRKALGASVKVVFSPMDAIELAKENPDREYVFLGVGFETTAPGTAAALMAAAADEVRNFSILCILRRIEPAIRALYADPDFDISAFLCPGHVATILGEKGFAFIPEELRLPAVISGFDGEDVILSVAKIMDQLRSGQPKLENEYTRAVAPEGNPLALAMIDKYLCPCDAEWRGLGVIKDSGYGIRPEYAAYDAAVKFGLQYKEVPEIPGCRCSDIICGRETPRNCPLFGKL